MLPFVFPSHIQDGIAKGIYEVVVSKGVPISIARAVKGTANAGQFVGHAIGVTNSKGGLFQTLLGSNPVIDIINSGLSVGLMAQTHLGFQRTYREIEMVQQAISSLQKTVTVLQTTTAIIGVGVAVGTILSGVNLWQTLKLKEDVKNLRWEVQNGFIDLKSALRDQGKEIIQHIDLVAKDIKKDIKFEQHRLILIGAYGSFAQALNRLEFAFRIEDFNRRNTEIDAARGMLYEALADYTNPHLFEEVCAAGRLRRLECAWAIDQAIATTYQMQNELAVASDRLSHLQGKMSDDCLNIVQNCSSEEELDFLFPEIAKLQFNDIPAIAIWKNHLDWIQTLSPGEKEDLANLPLESPAALEPARNSGMVEKPEELIYYEDLKQRSHYSALHDRLRFLVKPELRRERENAITQQAIAANRSALVPKNWEEVPDLTVANLYYYLQQ